MFYRSLGWIVVLWCGVSCDINFLNSQPIEITEVSDTVVAVEGGRASLPCNITPPRGGDAVALVLWYKDESTTPLYSLDARRGPLNQARHAAADEVSRRAYLVTPPESPSTLQLDGLTVFDEGEYRCRVDFRKARSRNSLVVLDIIVPPKKPVILDTSENELQRVAGPFNEGDHLTLSCHVEGGKPLPAVTWWRDGTMLDDSFSLTPQGVMRNDLDLRGLRRSDLLAVVTCQASNTNLTAPASSWVALDMNLPPLEAVIENKGRALSADRSAELSCRTSGSRPAATVTWWRGESKIKRTRETLTSEGNVTRSILTFVPTADDDGQHVACRAENPMLPGQAVEDDWKLEVNYAPILVLRLGSKLRHSHIQEGNDVYLECSVRANPRATEVGWRFEGRELHTNTSAGIIVSNQSLVLQRVKRHARGRYTCTAANTEGRKESAPLYLRVQYTPICKSDQKVMYGVARHEPVQVSCEVESDPVEVDFQWRFNNSAESLDTVIYSSRLNRSVATYIPRNEYDYGSLLCWGRNSVGLQKEPCVFAVIPAGAPDPVTNCSITNMTEESFVVRCTEGYDGGLGQNFLLELMPLGGLPVGLNVSAAEVPHFICRGLSPGIAYRVRVFAINAKGRSRPAVMRASTLASPESLTQRDAEWQTGLSPILILLVALVAALVLVAIAILLGVKVRRLLAAKGRKTSGSANEKCSTPLHHEQDDRRDHTLPENDAKCPDIIPADSGIAGDTGEEDKFDKELYIEEIPTLPPAFPPATEYPLNTWEPNQIRPPPVPSSAANHPDFRPQWTLPRTTGKLKNRQTDV